MKQKKTWTRRRHSIITQMVYYCVAPYAKWKYRVKIDRFHDNPKRQYLILLNHQTPFDQFFVGISFKRSLYYLATEDIFSKGWVSSLIRFLVAPIPIKKQTADLTAVRNCIRVANEGGSIVIAPEGNRTYSGKTEYMNPSIAMLARKLDLPIALYRIEGGYGAQPRWSDGVRKGQMHAYVSRVIEPEEYASMTNDELYTLIRDGLYVNEAIADCEFHSKTKAEYLERAIYVCPHCGLSVLESHGDIIRCTQCGREIRYGANKELHGVDCEFPFRFVNDWYEYQRDFVNALNTADYLETPLFRDTVTMSEVIVYKKKMVLRKTCSAALYGDRIVIDEGSDNEMCFPFDVTQAVTVLGRNKLNVYHDKRVYQFKGSKRFNALKYVNIYYRHRNILGGNDNEQFLGL